MKTKKTLLNFITDVVPLIIISILGIYKMKLFINVLGDETLGLYQLFSQIIVYVALVDGGLSNAVLFSLYKPNAEGDKKKFNALLAGSLKCFSLIGIAIFGIALLASFFVPFLIKDCSFNYWYIILTFLLFALSSVIGYFFVPYNCLLEVKEKKYIYNLTSQIGQIVLSTCEIIMLLCGVKFEFILLMHSVVKLLSYLVEMYICKKKFPDIKLRQEQKDFSFKKHINSLAELSEEDEKYVWSIHKAINKIAKDKGFDKSGYRVIVNCGKDAGQEVMHLHYHILAGEKFGDKIV